MDIAAGLITGFIMVAAFTFIIDRTGLWNTMMWWYQHKGPLYRFLSGLIFLLILLIVCVLMSIGIILGQRWFP
jgi:hypothetical protein